MAQSTSGIYPGKDGMLYVKTDSGGVALTDAIKELYGSSADDITAQYAAASGVTNESLTPSKLIDQYASALKSAEAARANTTLAEISAAEAQSHSGYDDAARQLYTQKTLSEKAMANSLASAGLYNSGYSDTARIALENEYAAGLAANEAARQQSADEYRLERIKVLSDLAASGAETDALAAQLGIDQYNTDREFMQILQEYADSRADAEWKKEQTLKEYADSRADAEWEKEQAEKAYADARADIEWERSQALAEAESKKAQQDLENAYAAAEMGDFSQLEALGMDTGNAKAAYQAELELLLLKLREESLNTSSSGTSSGSVGSSGGSSGGSKSSSSGTSSSSAKAQNSTGETSGFGTYETELATNLANRLVSNMQSQNKTYSQVLDYISSIRSGVVKQFGEEFWDVYVDVISKSYPGGSGYSEPERLSSISSVMSFISDSKNASRFFTDSGYNKTAIRELISNADLSEAEKNELRVYYGLLTSNSGSGRTGNI